MTVFKMKSDDGNKVYIAFVSGTTGKILEENLDYYMIFDPCVKVPDSYWGHDCSQQSLGWLTKDFVDKNLRKGVFTIEECNYNFPFKDQKATPGNVGTRVVIKPESLATEAAR